MSLLTHTTRSPRFTLKFGGLNCMFSIATTYVFGAAIAFAGSDASIAQASAVLLSAALPGARRRLTTAFLQRRLQMLRVFQMRDEGGPDLYEQRFQLFVLRTRNQRFIERIEHVFMVGHFVIDVRAVEG